MTEENKTRGPRPNVCQHVRGCNCRFCYFAMMAANGDAVLIMADLTDDPRHASGEWLITEAALLAVIARARLGAP